MNAPIQPIQLTRKRLVASGPKPVPAAALTAVREALGEHARLDRRDLLIEHLHVLNDRFGQLRTDHLAALAELTKLSLAEVHEVASFYHHFDIAYEKPDGSFDAPAALTVRVCDGLACEMAGARELLAKLPALLGAEVHVIAAPCIGRCEQAPAVAVHQHPLAERHTRQRAGGGRGRCAHTRARAVRRLRRLSRARRLWSAARVPGRHARRRIGAEGDGIVGVARPRRRRLPGGAQMAHRPRRTGAAADGGEHRRRRTGHVQGPRLPRDQPAPLHRRHADRGLGGRHRGDLHLPARRIPRLPRAARTRAGCAARVAADGRHAVDRTSARRRRVHLRRRVRDDRIDRRQARHAAAAPAVRGAGGAVRQADARAQLRDAVLGAGNPGQGCRRGSRRRAATAARACVRSRYRGG